MRPRPTLAFALALTLTLALASVAARADPMPAATPPAAIVLKLATLAPEGSSWMKLFHAWSDAVFRRTDGRVRVKFYTGGVQGDERDVLRKIKLGQLQGGAFTAIGLSEICPDVRALDAARTDEERAALRAALVDRIKWCFEQRGYVFGGWGDVGPIFLFSQIPVRSLDDVGRLKLWQWNDDPISRRLFETFGIHGVPLPVPEVLFALANGRIDAFFATPLVAMAMQWSGHARAMSALSLGTATGGTVFAKVAMTQLSFTDLGILDEEGRRLEAEATRLVRHDNEVALASLRKLGIQIVDVPPAFAADVEQRVEAVAREARKGLTPAIADDAERILGELRRGKGAAPAK